MRSLMLLFAFLLPLAAGEASAFLVKRVGASLQVVQVPLSEGHPLTVRPGGEVVAVVVPAAEGQSADLVRSQDGLQVTLEAQGARLRVRVKRGGADREVLDRPVAELQALRIRIHITTGDGLRGRWRIDGWRTVAPEGGPVLNLFAGQIPLGPQDAVLTTQVEQAPVQAVAAESATLPLTWAKGHPSVPLRLGNRTLPAVVDTAAATTLVGSNALPPGQAITPATMAEISATGRRSLPLEAQGAGGATTGFGTTTLSLALGSRDLGPTPVLVPSGAALPPGLPEVILGLDVLVPLGRVRFERTSEGGWQLRIGARAHEGPPPAVEVPLVQAGALFGVEARVGGHAAFLVIDSGSPHTFLPPALAHRAGWQLRPLPGPAPRGLDGRPLIVQGTTASMELGTWTRRSQDLRVGDLPVLAKFTGNLPVGLLGSDVLGTCRAFELDFYEGRFRLWN